MRRRCYHACLCAAVWLVTGIASDSAPDLTWQWTRQRGSSSTDVAFGIAMDGQGDALVAGVTAGALDGNTNAGAGDMFLMKFNGAGTWQWSRQRGTPTADFATAVTIDSTGNAYVTGFTDGNLDGNTNAGKSDMYVMKFNSAGVHQWTRVRGSAHTSHANAIALDASENVYVCGNTAGSLVGNSNQGSVDVYVMKFDHAGVWQWTLQKGGAATDYARAVTVDANGGVYVAGSTDGTIGSGQNSGSFDMYVMKCDTQKVWWWTTQRGSSGRDHARALVEHNGALYVAGSTDGSLDGFANAGSFDIFLMKFGTAGGSWIWTRQRGTAADDSASSVAKHSDGSLYVAGGTAGGLDGNANVGASYDMFMMKFDTAGTWHWTLQRGCVTASYVNARALAVDVAGSVYVAGSTDGNPDGNANNGGSDVFLMKFAPGTTTTTTMPSRRLLHGSTMTFV